MAKPRDQPIDGGDLREYLDEQDDFALELFAYRTAAECGLEVRHGGSYEDPATRKTRQFDVRAASERRQSRIDFAIECKALRSSYPMLISRVPRPIEHSFHEVIHAHVADPSLQVVMPGVDTISVLRVRGADSVYPPGEEVGKSTTQVGKSQQGAWLDGDREVYDKWSQALASSADLIAEAGWSHEKRGRAYFRTVVLPVFLVSNGTRWVADYSENGKLTSDPYSVNEAVIYVGHQEGSALGPSYTMSHLHVLTRDALRGFLEAVVGGTGPWAHLVPA